MFLAEKTVKNYVSTLFAKLGLERRTQAAAYAARVFGDHHDEKRGDSHVGPDVNDLGSERLPACVSTVDSTRGACLAAWEGAAAVDTTDQKTRGPGTHASGTSGPGMRWRVQRGESFTDLAARLSRFRASASKEMAARLREFQGARFRADVLSVFDPPDQDIRREIEDEVSLSGFLSDPNAVSVTVLDWIVTLDGQRARQCPATSPRHISRTSQSAQQGSD